MDHGPKIRGLLIVTLMVSPLCLETEKSKKWEVKCALLRRASDKVRVKDRCILWSKQRLFIIVFDI